MRTIETPEWLESLAPTTVSVDDLTPPKSIAGMGLFNSLLEVVFKVGGKDFVFKQYLREDSCGFNLEAYRDTLVGAVKRTIKFQ